MLSTALLGSLLLLGATHGALLGGPREASSSDQLGADLLHFAVNTEELRSNNAFARKPIKVSNLNIKTVSGRLYEFDVLLGPTGCLKAKDLGEDLTKSLDETCTVDKDAQLESCHFSVWDQPWTQTKKLLTSSCSRVEKEKEEDKFIPGHVQILGAGSHGSDAAPTEQSVDEEAILTAKMKDIMEDKDSKIELLQLQSHHNFKKFVKLHKKEYKTEEEYNKRFEIFRANMQKLQFLQQTEQGSARYGITEFSDMDESEFKGQRLGFNPGLAQLGEEGALPLYEFNVEKNVDLPKEFDWRKKGAVTEVKNQGNCGSCWAFSVTGNVEGQNFVKNGNLVSLSEQELVDCDKLDNGCEGGLPSNAYNAIVKLGGLEPESAYTYDGQDDQCTFDPSKVRVTLSGGVQLPTNETQLAQWLVQNGPISIGINANAMMFYYGGVSHPWKFLCRPGSVDHGVLIVGFGVDYWPLFKRTLPYWIVKNSWGTTWGEQGYYRVYRGDGTCGLNTMATSAVVN